MAHQSMLATHDGSRANSDRRCATTHASILGDRLKRSAAGRNASGMMSAPSAALHPQQNLEAGSSFRGFGQCDDRLIRKMEALVFQASR